MIELKNITKQYRGVTPLKDISVTINKGDVISVIGPSGTGKSTLIRCINLLERPTSGQIIFNGEDITAKGYDVKKARQKMGMVFQSFNLFGHLTVIENVMLAPMDLLGKTKQDAYRKGMELLHSVGVADKALSYPDELSGGQKQRVAIARTLAMDPELILLDEPTSALDPTMVAEVQSVIKDLASSGKTMIIVTHEMNFAKAISNRVFYLDEGGIYEEGTPEEIFDDPKKDNTRRFIKQLKVFETFIDSRDYDFIGFNSQLDLYLVQNNVPAECKYRIKLAIEELVQQIILPKMSVPCIRLRVEYSMKDGQSIITVTYKGNKFDISDTENTISLKILKSTAEDIIYDYDAAAELSNKVTVKIKAN